MVSHQQMLEDVKTYVGELHQNGVHDPLIVEAAVFAKFRFYAVVSTRDIKECLETAQNQITVIA